MSSLNKVRLRDGTEVAIAEWLHQPRYSVCEFTSTSAVSLYLFNYVRGQPVSHIGTTARNATDMDTNMVKRKSMNMDEALIVMAITYEVFSLTDQTNGSGQTVALTPMISSVNLRRLQFQGLFELYVGANIKKPQFQCPFEWVRQSIGTPAWVSGDAGNIVTRTDYGTGGEISAKNQELLKLPIYIGGFGQQARPGNSMFFQGKFSNPVTGAFTGLTQDVQLRFHLDGLGKRPA